MSAPDETMAAARSATAPADTGKDLLDTPAAGAMAVRGGALRVGGYVGMVALSVLSVSLLTRHLGVARFSEYVTVTSLVSVISSVTDAGMSSLGIREYAMRTGADRDVLMRDLLGLRVTLTLVGVALAAAFAAAAGYTPTLLLGTALAALSVVATVFQHTLSIPLATGLRMGVISGLDLARQGLTVALIVVLVSLDAGLLPLLAVALVANLALILPTATFVRGQISSRPTFHLHRWTSLLRLTVVFSLASAANTIYLYIAQIMTSLVSTQTQSGLFAASFRVFVVAAAVPGMAVAVTLPVLARAARDDRRRLAYALQRTFDASSIVGVATALGAVTGAQFIISVIAGPHFAAAAGALRIEGVALLASFLLAGWGFGLLALHRHRALLLANLAALAVSASLTAILASTDGARGAATASLCGEVALAILYLVALAHADAALRPKLDVATKAALSAAPGLAIWLATDLPAVLQPVTALAAFAVSILVLKAVPEELYELIPARSRRSS